MRVAEEQKGRHSLHIEDRGALRATGVSRVDFFSEELIAAQTPLGQLRVKGEGLHIESLNASSGELLARGKVAAVAYAQEGPARSFWGRLFR